MIVFIADHIAPPHDEGLKNIAITLIRRIAATHGARLITDDDPDIINDATVINLGKTFFNHSIKNALDKLKPTIIFYIPSASLTFASFIRAKMLKTACPNAQLLLLGLQARHLGIFKRIVLRFIKPDCLLVLSESMRRQMAGLSRRTEVFRAGVELTKFHPIPMKNRRGLRAKYNVPNNTFMILHVGHLNRSRNLTIILEVIKELPCPCTLCVVASATTKTEQDNVRADSLFKSDVIILDGTVEKIEEIYQMADCYIFPVKERTGAAEMPLSVLEAMATNLPVITTPYGALSEMFTECIPDGFYFADDLSSFADALKAIIKNPTARTRELVMPYSWEKCIDDLMQRVVNIL